MKKRRNNIAKNHTATHLLQAALRETLGEHVKQAGSHVGPERMRFDFTHFAQVSPDRLREIERLVNLNIQKTFLSQPAQCHGMRLLNNKLLLSLKKGIAIL